MGSAKRVRGHCQVVILLLTAKVDADSKTLGNETPLLRAVIANKKGVVELWLSTGMVDVNAKDS